MSEECWRKTTNRKPNWFDDIITASLSLLRLGRPLSFYRSVAQALEAADSRESAADRKIKLFKLTTFRFQTRVRPRPSAAELFRVLPDVCYDSLLALVYPQACTICGASVESRELGVACASCWERTEIFTRAETVCWKCGMPSPGNVAIEKREQVRCRRCDDDAYMVARACGVYEGALRATVLSLKRDPHVTRKLSALLLDAAAQFPLNTATRIIPVPLHPKRLKARGFNQASLIARELASAMFASRRRSKPGSN